MESGNQNDQRDSERYRPSVHVARRSLLKMFAGATAASVAAGLQAPTAHAIDYTAPVPESEGLTAYCNGQQVLVRWHNSLIAAYRAHNTGKYPYLGSLAGPITGTDVTTESSLPYPHHRGVWLGCQPLNGNDFWSDGPISAGQIRSVGLKIDQVDSKAVTFSDTCEWICSGADTPCTDERKFRISMPDERARLIDVAIRLSAHKDLVIDRAKHSFFAMRAAADISPAYGGNLTTSAGNVGATAAHGKTAAWCSYYGSRRMRRDVVEGIALMDHPENPWSPCPWLARDYGHLSPSPFSFLKKPWRLEQGAAIELRYLIVIHAGDPQEAGLAQVYKDWIST